MSEDITESLATASNGQEEHVEYTDDSIRHLSDMEHIRTRPAVARQR